MNKQEKIKKYIEENGRVTTSEITKAFSVSRQFAAKVVKELVQAGGLLKVGSTRSAFYVTKKFANNHPEVIPTRKVFTVTNKNVEEHTVLNDIEDNFVPLKQLPENIKSIFDYAFSEMLNNAIEHSQSDRIKIELFVKKDMLSFSVDDYGIGAFRNVMKKRNLSSPIEAAQDILKGKTTTMPALHSGEGIFFTSKTSSTFMLESYGYQLTVDNNIDDVFIEKVNRHKKGTKVIFTLRTDTKKHLSDVFKEYIDTKEEGEHGFDKTEIVVRLYSQGGVHISRSQARRIVAGLEKFDVIVMDYDRIPTVGQAFADEVYRVFLGKYPHIEIQNKNMNEPVRFMVERAITEAKKK